MRAGPASGTVGVALAFGLVVLMLAYAFGPVSGTHVNPAVTLAMVLAKRMPGREGAGYAAAQFAGAIAGAAMLKLFVTSFDVIDRTGALGTNSYDNGAINMQGAFVLEVRADRRVRPGHPAGHREGRRPRASPAWPSAWR